MPGGSPPRRAAPRPGRGDVMLPFMAIHLTRIYTRTGDDGTTALGDMTRVRKTDPRLVAYADVRELLGRVQNDLFDIGADLCTPVVTDPEFPPLRVTAAYTERLEVACDAYNERLEKLSSFLLPGGTPGAALLHVARTIVRRAERAAWALVQTEPDRTGTEPARYLNRLSDLLFILA